MVIPVSLSPFIMEVCIGAPPLYFGKREACTLIHLCFGKSNKILGIICPYAHVIIISGFTSIIF